jgi:small-conductance mechanosensitive channel
LVADQASEQVRHEEDPTKKLQIMSALDELDSLVPEQIALAQKLASDPSNKDLAKDVDQLNDELQDLLSSVSGPKIDLSNTARKEDEHVDKLVEYALKGDAPGVATEAKNLQKLTAKLGAQAREEAAKTEDPRRKQDLLKAVQDIEQLLPQEILAAKEVLEKPKDPKAKEKLQELSDKLQEALARADPLSADANAFNALQELDRLIAAAKKKDNKILDDASKQLPKAVAQITKHTKAKAKGVDNPAVKQQLLNGAGDLERLVPLHLQAARNVSENPNNKVNVFYSRL